MEKLKLLCLHGFLGQSSDWNFLRARWNIVAPDLFVPGPAGESSMTEWAENLLVLLPGRYVLVGYSLGGRLALHALAAAPGKFSWPIRLTPPT